MKKRNLKYLIWLLIQAMTAVVVLMAIEGTFYLIQNDETIWKIIFLLVLVLVSIMSMLLYYAVAIYSPENKS